MSNRWKNNRVCSLLGIEHPIIQGGMVYNSGAKLAAAVAEAGGLGLIGAGSMRPDLFREQIRKARTLTDRPFGVNMPLLYPAQRGDAWRSPWTKGSGSSSPRPVHPRRSSGRLKEAGCTVVHVVASPALAVKCQDAGCDAVVCEGFEAGGHNGREEITTMVLVPECVAAVDIPVIAAGGIATGAQLAAALALGADGVQIGSRFAVIGRIQRSRRLQAGGGRRRTRRHPPGDEGPCAGAAAAKTLSVTRIMHLEAGGAGRDELAAAAGHRPRAPAACWRATSTEGELEIGQVSGLDRRHSHRGRGHGPAAGRLRSRPSAG